MAGRSESPEALPSSNLPPSKSTRKVTPPERKGLHSPPAMAQRVELTRNPPSASGLPRSLLDYKRKAERGEVSPLTFIPISQQEYSGARDEIETTFRRFDYEPRRGRIILHMNTPTHETFITLIIAAISAELRRIGCDYDRAHHLTSRILNAGSSRIFLDDRDDSVGDFEDSERHDQDESLAQTRRQPDAQFQHPKARFPSVVIEVSYSQDGKQLSKLAKQYIHYSDGDIKVVICIDINSGSSLSTVSLWRPRFTPESGTNAVIMDIEQVMQERPFRAADGQPLNPDDVLALNLDDFYPDELFQDSPSITMTIPFAKLCEFVDLAEEMQQAKEFNDGNKGFRSSQRVKKHPPSSSSLEGALV